MSNFDEVRDFYDRMMSDKIQRRRRLQIEMEKKLEAEENAALEELARLMHEKFDQGMSKQELRQATRQYQSPKFKELWDVIPYEGNRKPAARAAQDNAQDFELTGDQITFRRGKGVWNWQGVDSGELTFTLRESENSGRLILTWGAGQAEHAAFNAFNMVALSTALEGVHL